MGLSFRKSINLGGGFRLNLSKSGVGFSTGVKGFRYSVGPRGAFINVGAKGIYYRKQISSNHDEQRSYPHKTKHEPEFVETKVEPSRNVFGVDFAELVDSSSADLIDEINRNMKRWSMAPLIRWGMVALSCYVSFLLHPSDRFIVGGILLVAGLIFAAFIDAMDWQKRSTPLFYELDADLQSKYQALQDACEKVSEAKLVRLVEGFDDVRDWKHSAGVSSALTTAPAAITSLNEFPFITTNVIFRRRCHQISIVDVTDLSEASPQDGFAEISA